MDARPQTISKTLDDVFAFLVAKQGLVPQDDLAGIEERPLAPFLVEHDVITADKADEILAAIGKSVLACGKCGAIYTGLAPADGKKYQCKKCKALIAYPQELTLEARATKFSGGEVEELAPSEAAGLPTAPEQKPATAAKSEAPGKNGSSPKLEAVAEKKPEARAEKAPEAPAPSRVEGPVKWYFQLDGKKDGPHETEKLAELVAAEKVHHDTFAWRKGMRAWQAAGELAEFGALLEDVPPPLTRVISGTQSSQAAVDTPAKEGRASQQTAPAESKAAANESKPASGESKGASGSLLTSTEPAPTPQAAPVDDKTCEEGKLAAILAYWFWPVGWFLKGQNPFARYHVGQGFVYFVFAVIVCVALNLVSFIFWPTVGALLARIPVLGPFMFYVWWGLTLLIYVVFLFITIKGTLNVLHKKQEPLPILNRVPLLGMIVRKIGNPA